MALLSAIVLLPVAVASFNASEIPRGNSERSGDTCGAKLSDGVFPPLTLAQCDEPLAPGAVDLRGYWLSKVPILLGAYHAERLEQCENRITLSGSSQRGQYHWVHDFLDVDGSHAGGCNDYNAGKFPACITVAPYGVWTQHQGNPCLEMRDDATEECKGGLCARRCLLPDGTISFFNANLAEIVGGELILEKKDASEITMGHMQGFIVPLVVGVVSLLLVCCCTCVAVCWWRRRKTKDATAVIEVGPADNK
mmetsp:Transcript_2265/g.4125  ORF Transcript_2265/g.4125 Transcript_2265/m.4125 type:complete len:251 (+) Transcript_2265:69-821(+)